MNKPAVIIGIIILIIGVVLVAVGAVGVLRGLTTVTSFTQPHSGEYVSSELILNTTSGIAVTSAAAQGGLIPAQDLNIVNSTNISQYALTPHSSLGGTLTYTGVIGDYYYVAFVSSQPSSKIVATPLRGGTVASSPLVLGGFGAVIAGIAVIVVGSLLRRKPKKITGREEERRNPSNKTQSSVAG